MHRKQKRDRRRVNKTGVRMYVGGVTGTIATTTWTKYRIIAEPGHYMLPIESINK